MLEAKLTWGEIVVEDTEGGTWCPNQDARAELSRHPENGDGVGWSEAAMKQAVEMCRSQPMRGTWKS